MTTDELIKRLNKNERIKAESDAKGIVVYNDSGAGGIVVYNDSGNVLLAIPFEATNFLEIVFNDQRPADSMGKASREYITAQIEEYLQTPIEERNPQKYYLCASKEKELYVHNVSVRDYPYDKSFSFEFGPKTEFSEHSLRELVKAVPNIAPALEAMKEPVEDD